LSYKLKGYGSTNNHTRRFAEIPSAVIGRSEGAAPAPNHSQRQWLKSSEVRKMLGISHGTLQNLRIKHLIHYQKIGGLMFYKYDDMVKQLEGDKQSKSVSGG
jgi:hypothetical protein